MKSKSIYKTKQKSGNKRNKCEIKRGIGYGSLIYTIGSTIILLEAIK